MMYTLPQRSRDLFSWRESIASRPTACGRADVGRQRKFSPCGCALKSKAHARVWTFVSLYASSSSSLCAAYAFVFEYVWRSPAWHSRVAHNTYFNWLSPPPLSMLSSRSRVANVIVVVANACCRSCVDRVACALSRHKRRKHTHVIASR